MRILFIGDVVGRTGRRLVAEVLASCRAAWSPALVIANVENVAGGAGVTPAKLAPVLQAGVDIATSGNHVFAQREAAEDMDRMPALVRPVNYPPGVPGRGWLVTDVAGGARVGVVNAVGRVFMDIMDCPFRALDGAVRALRGQADVIVVDFHAEATSEKEAMAHYLDGRVAAVIGTHTHVQTADERILPGGTAYITDVGMTGPAEGIIGTAAEPILHRFITRMPARFTPARGKGVFAAVLIDADEKTGRAVRVERVLIREG